MKSRFITGGLLGALLLFGAASPLVFTSCENEHPEISITLTSDYSGLLEAINNVNKTLTEKLALIEGAVKDGTVKNQEALELIGQAIGSLSGSMEEKLGAIETAIRSQTTSLESKLALIEAAVKNGFADSAAGQELIKKAIESLTGGMEEKLGAIETAIRSQTTTLEGKLALIEAAVRNGFADSVAAQELIKDAVESLTGSMEEKLGAIETAVKSQTTSLEGKLALIEAAVKNGFADSVAAQGLIKDAIESLTGSMETRLAAIETAVKDQTTSLETKLSLIEEAMKAQTLSLEGKLDLLKTAIENLPDYTDKLDAIRAAIAGLPDYSSKFDAVVTALTSIKTEIEALGAGQTAIATQIGNAVTAINSLVSEVSSGNTDAAAALALIIQKLEELKTAIENIETGGGSGSGSGDSPEGALTGKFSVGAGKQVQFSRGNLVATIDATGEPTAWKFAANQYDYLGEGGANKTIGTAAGDVDLFGWSTSATNFGINTSNDNVDYSGNFKDWGQNIGDGSTWRTLSRDEWVYLFNTRTNASQLYKFDVTVCGKTNCVIIAPDGFTGTIAASYDASTWPVAEDAGLVCLPAAGYRDGSSVDYVGVVGYYWSSSAYNNNGAYVVRFGSGFVSPDFSGNRFYGNSVRLITDVAGSAPEEPVIDPLSGKFSVSSTKQVQFSKGNLVATIDATGEPTAWKFAANQYDYLGEGGANKTIGTAAGDVDLFGWSTEATKYGISTSKDNADYYGNFVDWGQNIGDGSTWRTLTTDEWQYLFKTRTNASSLYKTGVTVCGKSNCVIIAPDGSTVTIAASYDTSTWPVAEAAGLVCLSAAGFRSGSSVLGVGGNGFYWSFSAYDSYSAYSVSFNSGDVPPGSIGDRFYGFSVRLITDVR